MKAVNIPLKQWLKLKNALPTNKEKADFVKKDFLLGLENYYGENDIVEMVKRKEKPLDISEETEEFYLTKKFQLTQKYRNKKLSVEERYYVILQEVRNFLLISINKKNTNAKRPLGNEHNQQTLKKRKTYFAKDIIEQKGFSPEALAAMVFGMEMASNATIVTNDEYITKLIEEYRQKLL